MNKILIVDNDMRAAGLLADCLREAGYAAITATDGLSGLQEFYDQQPVAVILAQDLPAMDGWTLASRIREISAIPLIILSAIEAEPDKLRAFEIGADDYVTKPFSCQEIVARLRAILKRANANGHGSVLATGDLVIDMPGRRVMREGRAVQLTPTEFRLLATLAQHKGRPLPHDFLIDTVWGPTYAGETGHIRRYVWSLRKKLEGDPAAPAHILTERGYGYRFD